MKGRIKRYINKKGYGFITGEADKIISFTFHNSKI